MPLLSETLKIGIRVGSDTARLSRRAVLFPVCANSGCASGWMRLWRARQVPVFEGGWLCGAACTRTLVRSALLREIKGHGESIAVHRHRVPLGLVLLAQGGVTREQLRAALAQQRLSGGRLGMWLQRNHGIEERVITRALGAQWGAPVLSVVGHSGEKVAPLVPRLFIDAFSFLPLRRAGQAILYVGFEDRIDRCVGLAIERMTGLKVEAGVVDGRDFAAAHRLMLSSTFPPARLVEAAGVEAMAATFTRILEAAKPVQSRLVRMRDYLWLRMWSRADGSAGPGVSGVEDVLGSLVDLRA